MRIVVIFVAMIVAGCGQTGSLYLPDDFVETPVEIRAPATPAAAPAPAPTDEDKEKKNTQPPGG
jgi:predicted small lipoprotein YifL